MSIQAPISAPETSSATQPLLREEANCFVMQDGTRIAKNALSPNSLRRYQALANGGEVKPTDAPKAKPKPAGMDLSRVKLVKEDDKAWHLSDDRGSFRVLKGGVSKALADRIKQHFACGGEVQRFDVGGAVQSGANPDTASTPSGPTPAEIASGRLDGQGLPALPVGDSFSGSQWDNPVDVAQSQGLAARTPEEIARGAAAAPSVEYDPTQGPPAPAVPGYFPEAVARVDTTPLASETQGAAAAPQPTTPPTPPIPKLPGVGAPRKTSEIEAQVGDAYRKAEAAAQAQTDVVKREAADTVLQQQENEKARADLQAKWQDQWNSWQARGQEIQRSILDQKIDPNHYWNEKSTGGKVSAAIGIILGGIGSGLTHQPNAALQVIQSAIDRDIDAQKTELGKKTTMLGFYLQQGHTLMASYQLARADMLDAAAAKLQMVATRYAGDKAAAQAQASVAALQRQAAMDRQEVASKGFAMSLQAMEATRAKALFPLQYQQAALGVEQGQIGVNLARAQYGALGQILNGTAGGGGRGGGFDPRVLEMPGMEKYRERAVTLPDGSTALARTPKDKENLDKSLEGAATLRSKLQRYGQILAAHPNGFYGLDRSAKATAQALRDSILTDINGLAGLNRFTETEAKIYSNRVPDITDLQMSQAHQAKIRELGREIDEKVWHGVRQALSTPSAQPSPVTTQAPIVRR